MVEPVKAKKPKLTFKQLKEDIILKEQALEYLRGAVNALVEQNNKLLEENEKLKKPWYKRW